MQAMPPHMSWQRQSHTFACWFPVVGPILLRSLILLCSILIVIIKGIVPATQQQVSSCGRLEQH